MWWTWLAFALLVSVCHSVNNDLDGTLVQATIGVLTANSMTFESASIGGSELGFFTAVRSNHGDAACNSGDYLTPASCQVRCHPSKTSSTVNTCTSFPLDQEPVQSSQVTNFLQVPFGAAGATTLDLTGVGAGFSVIGDYKVHLHVITPASAKTKLHTVCYDDIWFQNKVSCGANVPLGTLDFNWGEGPVTDTGVDYVSIRWTGKIMVPGAQLSSAEDFRFIALADDGVRVWIDRHLIIDAWEDNPTNQEPWGSAKLSPDTYHDIRVEYRELRGAAQFSLRWQSDSQPRQVIPADYLYALDPVDDLQMAQSLVVSTDIYSLTRSFLSASIRPQDALPEIIHPATVYSVGEEFKVYVHELDSEGNPVDLTANPPTIAVDQSVSSNCVLAEVSDDDGTLNDNVWEFTLRFDTIPKTAANVQGERTCQMKFSFDNSATFLTKEHTFTVGLNDATLAPVDIAETRDNGHDPSVPAAINGGGTLVKRVGQTRSFSFYALDSAGHVDTAGTYKDQIVCFAERASGGQVAGSLTGQLNGGAWQYTCSITPDRASIVFSFYIAQAGYPSSKRVLTLQGTTTPSVALVDDVAVFKTSLSTALNVENSVSIALTCAPCLEAFDRYGINVNVANGDASSKFQAQLGDAAVTVSFSGTNAYGITVDGTGAGLSDGAAELAISFDGVPIQGSPFALTISRSVHAPSTQLVSIYPSQSQMRIGEEVTLVVQLRDIYETNILASAFVDSDITLVSTPTCLSSAAVVTKLLNGQVQIIFTPDQKPAANANTVLTVKHKTAPSSTLATLAVKQGEPHVSYSDVHTEVTGETGITAGNLVDAGELVRLTIQSESIDAAVVSGGQPVQANKDWFVVELLDQANAVLETATVTQGGGHVGVTASFTRSTKMAAAGSLRARMKMRGGLKATYFKDATFGVQHASQTTTADKNFQVQPTDLDTKQFSSLTDVDTAASALPLGAFSIRWVGDIKAPVSGQYRLRATIAAGCGLRVTIDSVVVIDDLSPASGTKIEQAVVGLPGPDTLTPIEVEFVKDIISDVALVLEWQELTGQVPLQALPNQFLYGLRDLAFDDSVFANSLAPSVRVRHNTVDPSQCSVADNAGFAVLANAQVEAATVFEVVVTVQDAFGNLVNDMAVPDSRLVKVSESSSCSFPAPLPYTMPGAAQDLASNNVAGKLVLSLTAPDTVPVSSCVLDFHVCDGGSCQLFASKTIAVVSQQPTVSGAWVATAFLALSPVVWESGKTYSFTVELEDAVSPISNMVQCGGSADTTGCASKLNAYLDVAGSQVWPDSIVATDPTSNANKGNGKFLVTFTAPNSNLDPTPDLYLVYDGIASASAKALTLNPGEPVAAMSTLHLAHAELTGALSLATQGACGMDCTIDHTAACVNIAALNAFTSSPGACDTTRTQTVFIVLRDLHNIVTPATIDYCQRIIVEATDSADNVHRINTLASVFDGGSGTCRVDYDLIGASSGSVELEIKIASGQEALHAEYFNNQWLYSTPISTTQELIDQDWTTGLITATAQDYVSIRWSGYVTAPSGDLDFQLLTQADEGVRMRFGGTLVYDGWDVLNSPPTTVGEHNTFDDPVHAANICSGAANVFGGSCLDGALYELIIEYKEGTGAAEARLGIDTTGANTFITVATAATSIKEMFFAKAESLGPAWTFTLP